MTSIQNAPKIQFFSLARGQFANETNEDKIMAGLKDKFKDAQKIELDTKNLMSFIYKA